MLFYSSMISHYIPFDNASMDFQHVNPLEQQQAIHQQQQQATPEQLHHQQQQQLLLEQQQQQLLQATGMVKKRGLDTDGNEDQQYYYQNDSRPELRQPFLKRTRKSDPKAIQEAYMNMMMFQQQQQQQQQQFNNQAGSGYNGMDMEMGNGGELMPDNFPPICEEDMSMMMSTDSLNEAANNNGTIQLQDGTFVTLEELWSLYPSLARMYRNH